MLRALLQDNPGAWEDVLPQALFALRTTVCSSTGLTPFQLLFGRQCSQPLDTIFGNPNDETEGKQDHHEYLRKLRKRVDSAQRFARANMASAVIRQRQQYQKEKKYFHPGTKVWLYTPTTKPGMPRKLSSYWTGPWTICAEPVNSVMIRIAPDPTWTVVKGSKVVSIDRIKLYKDPTTRVREPLEDDDILMEGDEFAEYVANQPGPAVPAAVAPPRR